MKTTAEMPTHWSISAAVRGFRLNPNKGYQTVSQLIETLNLKPLRLGRTNIGLSRDDLRALGKALNRDFDESIANPSV